MPALTDGPGNDSPTPVVRRRTILKTCRRAVSDEWRLTRRELPFIGVLFALGQRRFLAGTHPSSPHRLIDAFAQILPGFEVRRVFVGNRNRLATFRIAPGACGAVVQAETAEATDFDPTPLYQCMPDGIKHLLDREGGVLRRQTGETGGKGGDEISARHGTDCTFCNAASMSCFDTVCPAFSMTIARSQLL